MKKKLIQVYEIDPEEFKNEILAGVEKLLKNFSGQFTPKHPEIWMNKKRSRRTFRYFFSDYPKLE